jgi:hypothetical protein
MFCRDIAGSDFFFASERGDTRQGFGATELDIKSILDNCMTGAEMSTGGAYLAVWNIVTKGAAEAMDQGIWTVLDGDGVDLQWHGFDMPFYGASQPVDSTPPRGESMTVGLLVGNMLIQATFEQNHPPQRLSHYVMALQMRFTVSRHGAFQPVGEEGSGDMMFGLRDGSSDEVQVHRPRTRCFSACR